MPTKRPSTNAGSPRVSLTMIPELEHAKAAALCTLVSGGILVVPTKMPSTSSSLGIALSRGLDSTVLLCCDIARSSNHSHSQLRRLIFISPRSAV